MATPGAGALDSCGRAPRRMTNCQMITISGQTAAASCWQVSAALKLHCESLTRPSSASVAILHSIPYTNDWYDLFFNSVDDDIGWITSSRVSTTRPGRPRAAKFPRLSAAAIKRTARRLAAPGSSRTAYERICTRSASAGSVHSIFTWIEAEGVRSSCPRTEATTELARWGRRGLHRPP
jgi:hypothetical protein